MVEENNSYERVIDRSCPLCTLPVDGDTDSLCTQCRSRVLLPIESVENSQQSTQPIVQTKKSEESQRVSNTLVFATLPIEQEPPASESNRPKKSTHSIWEKGGTVEGNSIGHYHGMERLGTWRFGTIYTAEHVLLKSKVRLITLDNANQGNNSLKQWFLATATSISKIDRNFIAGFVLDFGQINDVTYVALSNYTTDETGYLKHCATQPVLDESKEHLSQALANLIRGLVAFHSGTGCFHGSISRAHIHQGESPLSAAFCPFATGFPQETFVDHEGKHKQNVHSGKRDDFRKLILGFVQELLHDQEKIPNRIKSKWLQRRFPAMPPKLAKLLAEIARFGIDPRKTSKKISTLGEISNAPLRRITWNERRRGVLKDLLVLQLSSFFIIPPVYILTTAPKPVVSKTFFIIYCFVLLTISQLLWEPLTNSTIGKRDEFFLLDGNQKIPSRKKRFIRSLTRFSTWLLITLVILSLIAQFPDFDPRALFEEKVSNSNSINGIAFSALLGVAIVYCLSIFLNGQTLHDWISQTYWVVYRKPKNTSVLKDHLSEVLGLKKSPSLKLNERDQYQTGIQIDDITIGDCIGRGGMGIVYRGWYQKLNRQVAMKLILKRTSIDEEALNRFRREAEIGFNLNHPNIAKVYSVGYWEDQPYMILEYVDGMTLHDIIKQQGAINPVLAWELIQQAARALQSASNLGIVHRDIKPANLMLTRDGIVKVMDFGVSRIVGYSEPEQELKSSIPQPDKNNSFSDHTQLTRTGMLLGTPLYMSPEQMKGEHVDFRSDIYSLGLTLYTLLSGSPAFDGAKKENLMKRCFEMPPRLQSQNLTDAQNQVLEKMLSTAKEDRYQSYQDLLFALDQTEPQEATFPDGRDRGIGFLVDIYASVVMLLFVENLVLPASWFYSSNSFRWQSSYLVFLPAFAVKTAIFCSYVGYSHFRYHATPGQRLFRLKVLPADGYQISPKQLVLRSLYLSIIAAIVYFIHALSLEMTIEFLNQKPGALNISHPKFFVSLFSLGVFLFFSSPIVLWLESSHYSNNSVRTVLDRLSGTKVVKIPRTWTFWTLIRNFFRLPKG